MSDLSTKIWRQKNHEEAEFTTTDTFKKESSSNSDGALSVQMNRLHLVCTVTGSSHLFCCCVVVAFLNKSNVNTLYIRLVNEGPSMWQCGITQCQITAETQLSLWALLMSVVRHDSQNTAVVSSRTHQDVCSVKQKKFLKGDLVWNGIRKDLVIWKHLSLRLDFVAENKVSSQPQDDEENSQDDEINVELRVLHVQQLQNLFRLLELTQLPGTLQLWPVHAVDGQEDPFKAVPVTQVKTHFKVPSGSTGSKTSTLEPVMKHKCAWMSARICECVQAHRACGATPGGWLRYGSQLSQNMDLAIDSEYKTKISPKDDFCPFGCNQSNWTISGSLLSTESTSFVIWCNKYIIKSKDSQLSLRRYVLLPWCKWSHRCSTTALVAEFG